MMHKISATLNCKNIIQNRRKNNLPIYDFGLGENKLNQPKELINSLINFSNKKHYTNSSGIPELQKEIKRIYSNDKYKINNILIGNGLKELLFIIQISFSGKIFHITPSWVSYKEQINIVVRK